MKLLSTIFFILTFSANAAITNTISDSSESQAVATNPILNETEKKPV